MGPSSLPFLLPLVLALTCRAEVLETDTLILGGGMTGVAAAHALSSRGLSDFLLLEARPVLGGRVQSHPIGNSTVEFGANWIQGLGNNPIWAMAQKYGLKNRESIWSDIDYFTSSGWQAPGGSVEAALNHYEEEVFAAASAEAGRRKDLGEEDLSMKAGLRLVGWNPKTPEEKLAEYYSHDWEQAEPPIESSFIRSMIAYNETFVESGSDQNNIVIDPRGYSYLIERYAAEIPGFESKVKFNQYVNKVEYSRGGVTVRTESGLVVKAKRALCTFSVGVLQHDDVEFSPSLPSKKKEAIYNFHLATYTKIFLRFPHKFWNGTELAIYADPDERGHFPVWQFFDAFQPGANIVFATLTGQQAYQVEDQVESETIAEMLETLRTMYGKENVPEPLELSFPRWTKNRLFRGSFSNWGAGVTEKQQDEMRAPVPHKEKRLWFAGEHTSRRFFGYLHGAYWEGRSAGMKMADCIMSGCKQSKDTKEAVETATVIGKEGRAKTALKRRMWSGRRVRR